MQQSHWRKRSYGSHKTGLNTKIHVVVDAFGVSVRVIIAEGITAGCRKSEELIDGFNAGYLLADRGLCYPHILVAEITL